MTRILFTGDHHWDVTKRWDECTRIHDWMVDEARRQEVDAFVSCGDIYERASTPEEREAVSSWLIRMAKVCPVYIVRGNHDRHLDCAIMGKLQSTHPIYVEESASVVYVKDTAIALIAWPERARILQAAQVHGVAPDMLARDALHWLLAGLGLTLAAHAGPRLAAGHLMIDGAETSTGQPLLGQPINVPLDELRLLGADMVVAGHIHLAQDWLVDNAPVAYVGSPYRTNYGEREEKSVLLVDTTLVVTEIDRPALSFERIPTPCSGMILISEVFGPDGFQAGLQAHVDEHELPGAFVRLRYEVAPENRLLAKRVADEWAAVMLQHGAVEVAFDVYTTTGVRARAPEIAEASTLADKLLALWKARSVMPEAEQRARLLDKAAQLEAS